MNQTADLTEKTLSREEKYQGSFLSLHVDQVQLPNGRTSFREVVEHVDGVAILALDDRNNVLTVTQYRYVIGKTLLEIPAGKLEPGEDPVAGALRELKEELGVTAAPQDLHVCGLRRFRFESVFHGRPFKDNQVSRVFCLWLDKEAEDFTVQRSEIDYVKWFDLDEAIRAVDEGTIPNCIFPEELGMVREFVAGAKG